jgi:hypothetical protein
MRAAALIQQRIGRYRDWWLSGKEGRENALAASRSEGRDPTPESAMGWAFGCIFFRIFFFYGSYDLSDRDFLRSNYFIFQPGCRYRQTGNGSWSVGVEDDPVDNVPIRSAEIFETTLWYW